MRQKEQEQGKVMYDVIEIHVRLFLFFPSIKKILSSLSQSREKFQNIESHIYKRIEWVERFDSLHGSDITKMSAKHKTSFRL